MLVLTRREGEAVLVGGDVKITVLALDRGRVRIGIDAPTQVPVDREEVRQEKEASANG